MMKLTTREKLLEVSYTQFGTRCHTLFNKGGEATAAITMVHGARRSGVHNTVAEGFCVATVEAILQTNGGGITLKSITDKTNKRKSKNSLVICAKRKICSQF